MATKRAITVRLSIEETLPLAGRSIRLIWEFESSVDGLPEVQPPPVVVETIEQVSGGQLDLVSAYQTARAAAFTSLATGGLGGHTVLEGP